MSKRGLFLTLNGRVNRVGYTKDAVYEGPTDAPPDQLPFEVEKKEYTSVEQLAYLCLSETRILTHNFKLFSMLDYYLQEHCKVENTIKTPLDPDYYYMMYDGLKIVSYSRVSGVYQGSAKIRIMLDMLDMRDPNWVGKDYGTAIFKDRDTDPSSDREMIAKIMKFIAVIFPDLQEAVDVMREFIKISPSYEGLDKKATYLKNYVSLYDYVTKPQFDYRYHKAKNPRYVLLRNMFKILEGADNKIKEWETLGVLN